MLVDGFLDELNQAFVTIDFGQGPLDFQIDTGFCGTLVIGEELFDSAHAEPAGTVEAELAAGQIYVYPSFVARSRWLGMDAEIEILVGPGQECLLGTDLLNPHRLEIDFRTRSVRLMPDKQWLSEP